MRRSSRPFSQRLLVSVMDQEEALCATRGGAHLIDAEDPISALGVVSPARLTEIRRATPAHLPVTTNIGELQVSTSKSQQAALGVALSGADVIKVGLCEQDLDGARELLIGLRDTLSQWFAAKRLVPAVFADRDSAGCPEAIDVVSVAAELKMHGVLIDTLDKQAGRGLLDLMSEADINVFVDACHKVGVEAWLAGSLDTAGLRCVWVCGADVARVRGAACGANVSERTARVREELVRALVETIPE